GDGEARQHRATMLDVVERLGMERNPGSELHVNGAELVPGTQHFEHAAELPPQLYRQFRRQLVVIDVLLVDRSERVPYLLAHADDRRLVTREQPIRLDVEDEAGRRSLHPPLRVLDTRDPVV